MPGYMVSSGQFDTKIVVTGAAITDTKTAHAAIAKAQDWKSAVLPSGSYRYQCLVSAPGILPTDFLHVYPSDLFSDDFIFTNVRRYLDTGTDCFMIYSKIKPSGNVSILYTVITLQIKG